MDRTRSIESLWSCLVSDKLAKCWDVMAKEARSRKRNVLNDRNMKALGFKIPKSRVKTIEEYMIAGPDEIFRGMVYDSLQCVYDIVKRSSLSDSQAEPYILRLYLNTPSHIKNRERLAIIYGVFAYHDYYRMREEVDGLYIHQRKEIPRDFKEKRKFKLEGANPAIWKRFNTDTAFTSCLRKIRSSV